MPFMTESSSNNWEYSVMKTQGLFHDSFLFYAALSAIIDCIKEKKVTLNKVSYSYKKLRVFSINHSVCFYYIDFWLFYLNKRLCT